MSGGDAVLMSTLINTTSLGTQLADNYDKPKSLIFFNHYDSSINNVKGHNNEQCMSAYGELKLNMSMNIHSTHQRSSVTDTFLCELI